MRFAIRIEIHDKEYKLLHERAEAASFSRTTVDSSTGKRVHLPIGEYVTEAYPTARMVLLKAIQVAFTVDPAAEIIVSGGNEFLTFGCPEVQENPSSFFGQLFGMPAIPTSDPFGTLYRLNLSEHKEDRAWEKGLMEGYMKGLSEKV